MDENKNYQPEEEKTETVNEAAESPVAEGQNAEVSKPEEVDDGKGLSIAALVLGILGIVGGWIPIVTYFTFVCAILGIIFGVKGRKKSEAIYGKPSGLATAGFILGIIGTACGVIGLICTACVGIAACASL